MEIDVQRIPASRLGIARLLARPQPYLSGTICPSGRFTVGSRPKNPPNRLKRSAADDKNEELSDLPRQDSSAAECEWDQLSLLQPLSEVDSGVREEETEGITPLGLSSADISHKISRRGSKGISSKAADALKYWLSQFESRWTKRRISFLTLTCPEVRHEDRVVVQENWSEIVRRFVQELKRELGRRRALSDDVLGCTEIQEERAASYGWAVPHLHLVFCGKRSIKHNWILRPEEIRGLWKRVLSAFIDVADVDFRAAENIQGIRGSTAGYLAKYLSKSLSKNSATAGAAGWHPSSYVVLPTRLRRWFRGKTCKGSGIPEHILEICKSEHKIHGLYIAPVTIKTSIGDQVVGLVGRNPEWVIDAERSVWRVTDVLLCLDISIADNVIRRKRFVKIS